MKQSRIDDYIRLLKAYNETTNVYSKSAYDRLDFHVQDSVCLAQCIGNSKKNIIDLGSGSGMPSVILAIQNDRASVTAVESKGRKARFIAGCADALELKNLRVLNEDANTLTQARLGVVDVVTAKAFAKPLDVLKVIGRMGLNRGRLWIPASEAQCLEYGHSGHFGVHEARLYGVLFRYLVRDL